MFRKRDTHIHFVGIGGIGMSGIAEVLVNLGYRVSGTDLNETDTTRRLVGLGANVQKGHRPEHLGDADVVVVSSAVPPDNPEVLEAHARHIPVIPRAEMLGELGRLKQGLFIAGSHGKTTTTSLVASVLHEAGLDPTVVIGGKVNGFDSNARLGYGDVLVAEADESDGSFSFLSPTIAILTNIDAEHLEHYGSVERLVDAFVDFANRVPFYGQAIVCVDDPRVREILPRLHKRTVTYGQSEQADYRATDIRHDSGGVRFEVQARGDSQGEFTLRMPGVHNVLNALATIALCDEQQVHVEATRQGLANFAGVQRRFTLRGEEKGVLVVDDYGHHPTEIAATIDGARQAYPNRRIIACVQPHRFTRLRDHFDEFARCLDGAQSVFVTDVYPAGEKPIDGIDSATLCERVRAGEDAPEVQHVAELGGLAEAVIANAREGDLVLTLGAGSITRVSHELIERLGARA